MKRTSAFTLLELLIVMVILGVLFVMLLNTYNWISTMVFRVQQEKEVSQEILQTSQIMQNFADRNTIDYNKYWVTSDEWRVTNLVANKWITDVLYLSGQDGEIRFFSTGECVDPAQEYLLTGAWSWCHLYMATNDKTIELINSQKVAISKVIFKIIPFASEEQYITTEWLCEEGNYLHCLNAPGFRMIFTTYSINYGTQWATHIKVPFQQFF